jgi:hypothetical protein
MPQWISDSALAIAAMTAIATVGALRFITDRQFRVRGSQRVSARLLNARRSFVWATAVTLVGMIALVARASGGPLILLLFGPPVTILGIVTLVVSFVWLTYEHFRRNQL